MPRTLLGHAPQIYGAHIPMGKRQKPSKQIKHTHTHTQTRIRSIKDTVCYDRLKDQQENTQHMSGHRGLRSTD